MADTVSPPPFYCTFCRQPLDTVTPWVYLHVTDMVGATLLSTGHQACAGAKAYAESDEKLLDKWPIWKQLTTGLCEPHRQERPCVQCAADAAVEAEVVNPTMPTWPPMQPMASTVENTCWWCGTTDPKCLRIYSQPEKKHDRVELCRGCLKMMAESPVNHHFGVWTDQP